MCITLDRRGRLRVRLASGAPDGTPETLEKTEALSVADPRERGVRRLTTAAACADDALGW